MRIAIVAPGAVGGYFGVLLARSGENVGALARGAHLHAIAEHGLIAEGPRGTFSARLDASDDAAKLGVADIVLFAVKLYGAAEAARSAAPLFGPRTLGISLLNGIDGHEIMGRELPGRTVVGGSAYVSAVIAAPGKLRYTSDMSAITFGAPADGALRPKATAFIDSCRKAGFKADMVDDVMSSLWGKFIGLSTNAALTTAARLPAGPLYGDPDVMEVARALMQEAAAVGRAAGAKLPDDIVERSMTNSTATSRRHVRLDVPRLRQGRAHRDRGHVGLHRPRRTAARRADAAPRHDLRAVETAPRRHTGNMRREAFCVEHQDAQSFEHEFR